MIRSRLALALLISSALVSPAAAMMHGGSASVPATCPKPTRVADGCSAAPGYFNPTLSMNQPDLMTVSGPQVGQTYTPSALAAIYWNQAGVAPGYYAGVRKGLGVGGAYCNGGTIPCSPNGGDLAGLIDPTTYNWTTDPAATHCKSASYVGGLVKCTPDGTLGANLIGFDWSVGGCTALLIHNDPVGTPTVNVTDSYWRVDGTTGCLASNAPPWRIQLANANLNFSYNIINGNSNGTAVRDNIIVPNNSLSEPFDLRSPGNVTINHNGILNDPARIFSVLVAGTGSAQGNVFHNIGYWPGGLHGEHFSWKMYNTTPPNVIENNNTMWADKNTGPSNTAQTVLFPGTGTYAAWTVKNDTIITNGFTYKTIIENIPHISNVGAGYTVGDLITIPYTYNSGTPCETQPIVKITNTATGQFISQNVMACGSALSGLLGRNVSVDTATVNGIGGTGTGMTFDLAGVTTGWWFGNNAWNSANTVGNVSFIDNASDDIGASSGNQGHIVNLSGTTCTGTVTYSGNIDLRNYPTNNATFNTSVPGSGGC